MKFYYMIKTAKSYDAIENMMLDIPTYLLAEINKNDINQQTTIEDYFRHYDIEKIDMLSQTEYQEMAKTYPKYELSKMKI